MKTRFHVVTVASLIVFGLAGGGTALAEEQTVAGEQTVGERFDDAALLAKIKADMLKARSVDGLDVNVDVKDGVVTLSGQASSEAERLKAEQIAKEAKGVKSVTNKIAIKAK